jgi:4-methoxybenzoate monooxygenase (O-demethylating)
VRSSPGRNCGQALSDWQTFSSAAGVGIDDFRRTKPWRPLSLILEADPPLHTRSRTVMNRALSAKPRPTGD